MMEIKRVHGWVTGHEIACRQALHCNFWSGTSVSLEDEFWKALREIAHHRNERVSELVAAIDAGRDHGNLSSAIRLFILDYYHVRHAKETTASDASQVAIGS